MLYGTKAHLILKMNLFNVGIIALIGLAGLGVFGFGGYVRGRYFYDNPETIEELEGLITSLDANIKDLKEEEEENKRKSGSVV